MVLHGTRVGTNQGAGTLGMVQGMVQWEGQTAHCHIVPTLENLVTPHVHFSPVMLLASVAATVAVFGTLHLLALTNDNRASRAFVSLGF